VIAATEDLSPRAAYSIAWRCAAVQSTSPFYPEQALPEELVFGRQTELDLVELRGARQVLEGRQAAFFLRGGRGIGKSSFARCAERTLALRYNFVQVHVSLNGVRQQSDLGAAVLAGVSRTVGAWHDLFAMLSRYVRGVSLLGVVELDLEAVRADGPKVSRAEQVGALLERVREQARAAGVVLVLDEIEVASRQDWLGGYLKALWESDAALVGRLPLLMLVCGTLTDHEFIRRGHSSAARIWSVLELGALAPPDRIAVLADGFTRAGILPDPDALARLARASLGHPAALQMLGNLAFWRSHGLLGDREVSQALAAAPVEMTLKFLPAEVGSLPDAVLHALSGLLQSRPFGAPVDVGSIGTVLGELTEALVTPMPSGRLALVDPMLEVYTALRVG